MLQMHPQVLYQKNNNETTGFFNVCRYGSTKSIELLLQADEEIIN